MDTPYESTDPEVLADGLPSRGPACDACGVRIPRFASLTRTDRFRILKLILEGRKMHAMRELRAATGCGLRWAKIWVLHHGEPQPRFPGPPCPSCGAALPSSKSRQCLKCKADWHGQTVAVRSLPPGPPCGALLWTGSAASATWYVLSRGRAVPDPSDSGLDESEAVWLLEISSSDGYNEQHWWSPTRQILSGALPGWQSSDIKAVKAALSEKAREISARYR